MKYLGYILIIILVIAFVTAIINRFKDTYRDAIGKGHSPLASFMRGLAYVVFAFGGIFFFIFLAANIEAVGIWWTILLIFLFYGVVGLYLAQWIFDKKPKRNPINNKD